MDIIGLVAILTPSRSSFPNCAAATYYAVTVIKAILKHMIISKLTELLGWDGGRKSKKIGKRRSDV